MELSAIWKLEFYKNKNNWKLSKGGTEKGKKLPLSSKTTNELDKTYDVGEECRNLELDEEQVSPDNTVSLHGEPDDISDRQLQDFDPLEPEVPDLPGPETPNFFGSEAPDFPGPKRPDYNLYRQQSWSGQLNSEDRTEALGQDTQLPAPQPYSQNRCGMETAGILEGLACDQYDGPTQQHFEAPDAGGQDWLKKEFTSLYDEDQVSYIPTNHCGHLFQLYSQGSKVQLHFTDDTKLMDDTADFMRGAHLTMHSSEVDLNTTPQECPCIDNVNLWALSGKQLKRAIERHTLALALLLGEGTRARRDQLTARSVPYPRLPIDDWGNTNQLRPPDGIQPGGHRASSVSDGTGRGRGRLQQARKQYGTLS